MNFTDIGKERFNVFFVFAGGQGTFAFWSSVFKAWRVIKGIYNNDIIKWIATKDETASEERSRIQKKGTESTTVDSELKPEMLLLNDYNWREEDRNIQQEAVVAPQFNK